MQGSPKALSFGVAVQVGRAVARAKVSFGEEVVQDDDKKDSREKRARRNARRTTHRLGHGARHTLSAFIQDAKSARTNEVILDAGVLSHYLARDVKTHSQSRRASGRANVRPTLAQMYQKLDKERISFARSVVDTAEHDSEAGSSDTDFTTTSEEEEGSGKNEPDKASVIAARHRLLFAVQDEILKAWQFNAGGKRSDPFLTSVYDKGIRGSSLLDRFRVKVMEVCLSLRESKALNIEVEMVTLKYKLRPERDPDSIQKKAERNDRNDAFWRLYHRDDGKRHHGVAPDSQIAASMVATASKFWTPAQNAELPDAKLVPRGQGPGKADQKTPKHPKKSSRLAQDSPDADEDAGSLLVGTSTTRRLLQHRNIIRQRRIEGNEACTLSTLPATRSVPALQSKPRRDRKMGNESPHSALSPQSALSRSSKALQWASSSSAMAGTCSSWRSGARESDDGEDAESMASTKNGFFDYGKFMDTQDRFRRARQPIQRRARIRPVNKDAMETVSLPALTYASKTSTRSRVMQAAMERSRQLASKEEAEQRTANDGKLPPLAAAGKLGNSSSAPALQGPWKPSEKLPPVTRLPTAYDRTPMHAPSRVAGAPTTELEADADLATMRYIRVCRAAGVVPTPSVLTMALTHKITGEELTDDDLCAFATMVRSLDHLESVDIAGNALLSERALVPFLRKLFGRPASSTLTSLSLAGCKGAIRSAAIDTIVSLLTEPEGIFRLVHINLSGIAIPASSQLALCQAIAAHVQLRSVHLADTGLGLHPAAKLCVTSLLSSPRLQDLDLGWNCFASDVFEALGQHVADHKALNKLHLASCAAITAKAESPVTWFLECLSRDRTLTSLDVSLNRIDFRGALVLEDALEYHAKLTELSLGQNPLGVNGMRSFLRLLSRESSGLRHFECGQCDGQPAADELTFNATDPTGGYVLNLSNPYHRSVLRMLYKACDRFRLRPEKAFTDLEYSPESSSKGAPTVYRHPREKDKHGVWCVPNNGILSVKFNMVEVFSTCFTDDYLSQTLSAQPRNSWMQRKSCVQGCGQAGVSALEKTKRPRIGWLHQDAVVRDASLQPLASRFAERYLACVRYMPSIRKVVPLLAQWQSLKGQPREQQLLLDALSHDFLLTFGHINQFCCVKSRTVEVLSKLLPCMEGGPAQLYMALTLPAKMDDFLKVQHACQRLFDFNAENPTAHYRLDLGNTADYAVGETLVLINRWEAVMAKKKGCFDMSRYGNWSNFRNVVYQNQELSLADFQLPTYDTIELDFVSWRRPPPYVHVMADERWEQLMIMLTMSECKTDAKTKALRMVSDQFFLKALQLRELLSAFEGAHNHVEVVCIFLLRLGDAQNAKVVRARLTGNDHAGEWQMLRHRVGILSVFPVFQPEQFDVNADLSVYEDRMAVALIFGLAVRECIDNIKDLYLVKPNGEHWAFPKGPPPTWERYEEIPSVGKFHCKYVCTPTDRRLGVRKEFAFKYGGFSAVDIDKTTMWWSDLTQAPDPVLFFLYYCMRHFKDMEAPFKLISNGFKFISLDAFKKQMAAWKWRKFKKHPDWVIQVFRYLDPDSDGELTDNEWEAFVQLFKELLLSILEFLQYLNRTFLGDFDLAWNEIDADGSDSIDYDEWGQAMKDIRFFGVSDAIFYYLADDNQDLINAKGWRRLKDLWEDRHELRQKIAKGDRQCP
mmetsp:Transcript_46340/g.86923  ORF Transcript_46340/g.86923 Transcript_46340/m.86923 type:complete len:1675 (+) Transcript_46340:183-5207(+)